MANKYNIALIGCGQMGEAHISNIYYKENVRLKYVCDTDPERTALFARKYGADFAETDMDKCISDPEIDIVLCATYPSSHVDILKKCIASGKHLLCEKPIGSTLEEGREFARLVKENPQIKVLVGHILRHNETYRRAAEMIRSGAIGFPIIFRMTQNHHTMNWDRYLRLLNDACPIVDCGVHYFDVMQWFSGEKIVSLDGIGMRTQEDVPDRKYNYGLATVRLSGGSIGYYEAGWTNTISSDNMKEFSGPRGRISIVYAENRGRHHEEGDLIEYYKYPEKIYETINVNCDRKPTGAQFDHLVKMIETDAKATPTIDEVLSSFEAAFLADEKIKEFMKNGKKN